jgi:hypothetical protein
MARSGGLGPQSLLLIFACCAALSACGPTIGDACTQSSDCGGAVCVTKDYTPGGACVRSCNLSDTVSCPAGSVCVKNALGKDAPGCLRQCVTAADCRGGYVCRIEKDSLQPVCIGPAGI